MNLFDLDIKALRTEARRLWTEGNDSGNGYTVGNDNDDISAIKGIGELVSSEDVSDGLAIYRNGDRVVVVGDSNGPWAVSCSAEIE